MQTQQYTLPEEHIQTKGYTLKHYLDSLRMANGKKEESIIQFIRRGNLTETLAAFLEGLGLDLDLAGWM